MQTKEKHIILASFDSFFLNQCQAVLKSNHINFLTAQNGSMVLAQCLMNTIPLILLDKDVPQQGNTPSSREGLLVCRTLKTQFPSIPILIMFEALEKSTIPAIPLLQKSLIKFMEAGKSNADVSSPAVESKADGFIAKPLNPIDLIPMIQKYYY